MQNRAVHKSPLLYLIYDEAIIKEATYNIQLRVLVGGQFCNMITFAGDQALSAAL